MIRFFLTILAGLYAVPLAAQAISQQPHTRVELVAESSAPAAGQTLQVGIELTPQAGWHTYWQNPGDAGAPTRVAWTLPAGTPAPGPLAYPVPGTLLVGGIMNHVYEQANVLLTDIAVPAGLKKGTPFPVAVKVDWLVCSLDQCVPESATVALNLVIGDGAADATNGFRIANARAALPRPVDWPATWAVSGDRFVLAVPMGSIEKVRKAWFFPEEDGVIAYSAPQAVTRAGNLLRVETAALPPGPAGPGRMVKGVLRIEREGEAHAVGFALTARPGAVPAAGAALATPRGSAGTDPGLGLPATLLLAVLGGVVLNVMPCVFPILSLKALSLAKGNVDGSRARAEALAYAAGVVLVCAALGGLVLGLRAAGSQVGWAFQLQDPRVITGLLLLVTAIALNLAGLFEITVSTGGLGQDAAARGGIAGSFATGALAAFVATPCTGPFMATALGAALILPPIQAIAVFAGLGFGLALPFLLVAFVPALRNRLPRPGAWMTRLRAILSVPMFLTALALAWVLGRQAGVEGMTAGIGAALLLGLLLWWLGSRQHGGRAGWLPAGLSLAAVMAAILLLPVGQPATATATTAVAGLAPVKFSSARLAELRAGGTPVFLYMTADWCLTCKVNEKGAMADARVAAAFKAKGITVMEGDWTRGDTAISDWLAGRGRAGVPVYVFYAADGSETELPQLLTVETLTALGRGA